uniref:HTH CENPB-type domain-containing protein n=1 Tax=Stomoxys calcitrans TaxID=35570 RepID=A0A1I8NLW6_STOCA
MTTNQSDLQTKKTIKAISFQEKLAILKQLEAGVSRKEIGEQFKCSQSTLARVLVNKQILLELAEEGKNLNRKRVAMVTYKEIDEALSKWAQEMKRNNYTITAAAVKEKAEELARNMGQDFKPSAGWLYKWKERENVQFCKKYKTDDPDPFINSVANEDILKGLLLERKESSNGMQIPTAETKRLKMSEDEEYRESFAQQQNQPSFLDFVESTLSKNQQTPQQAHASPHLEQMKQPTPKSPPISSNTSPSTSGRKVPYSYDPVYVLTSTGRYRKEKTFLTLLQKLEILQRMKNGERRQDLIIEYRLSQSAMSQIVADEKKILKFAAIGQNLQMKRVRGGIFKEGEVELNSWVLKQMEEGATLTRSQIKTKAKEIADRMQIDFKASTGWLEKWKVRMNMDFNENQVLHRKIPFYASNTDEETHISNEVHVPEAIYGRAGGDDDDDIHIDHEVNMKRELVEADDYSFSQHNGHIDIKPFMMGQEQFVDLTDSESEHEDIKPNLRSPSPLHPMTLKTTVPEAPVATETLHQKILNWLSRHNIGPTASIELLTLLHPTITEASKTTN